MTFPQMPSNILIDDELSWKEMVSLEDVGSQPEPPSCDRRGLHLESGLALQSLRFAFHPLPEALWLSPFPTTGGPEPPAPSLLLLCPLRQSLKFLFFRVKSLVAAHRVIVKLLWLVILI